MGAGWALLGPETGTRRSAAAHQRPRLGGAAPDIAEKGWRSCIQIEFLVDEVLCEIFPEQFLMLPFCDVYM